MKLSSSAKGLQDQKSPLTNSIYISKYIPSPGSKTSRYTESSDPKRISSKTLKDSETERPQVSSISSSKNSLYKNSLQINPKPTLISLKPKVFQMSELSIMPKFQSKAFSSSSLSSQKVQSFLQRFDSLKNDFKTPFHKIGFSGSKISPLKITRSLIRSKMIKPKTSRQEFESNLFYCKSYQK